MTAAGWKVFDLSLRLRCVTCPYNIQTTLCFMCTWCYITHFTRVYVFPYNMCCKISIINNNKRIYRRIRTQPNFQECQSMRIHKQSDHITFQGLPTARIRESVVERVFNAKANLTSLTLGLVRVRGLRGHLSVILNCGC